MQKDVPFERERDQTLSRAYSEVIRNHEKGWTQYIPIQDFFLKSVFNLDWCSLQKSVKYVFPMMLRGEVPSDWELSSIIVPRVFCKEVMDNVSSGVIVNEDSLVFCLMAYQLFLGYLMPKPFS